jgi:hypothetical protein
VLVAIGQIEYNRDPKFRAHDPFGGPNDFFNLRVPGGVVIEYTVVDDGAAFVVTRVRRFVVG